MLERAAGVALCVEVRDLLDFQRAFVRDGLAVPEEETAANETEETDDEYHGGARIGKCR